MIYLQLLWVYLKIGTFGFGGGYAMLSLIQHEIVDLHHWLTPQQFTDVVAISQMTPGPIGINSATYVGYAVTHSVWGAVLATVAVCLPSFICGKKSLWHTTSNPFLSNYLIIILSGSSSLRLLCIWNI